VSTDQFPLPPPPAGYTPSGAPVTIETFPWTFEPPPRKFKHRYRTHIILFLLTFGTTAWAGSCQSAWFRASTGEAGPFAVFALPALAPGLLAELANGLWYAVPVLLILGAHEFGHYFACRYHDVDASLPYFIPAPLPLTGTLGAVIRIKEMFPSKKALFDIGVAGPLAGFVMLLPFLIWGLLLSRVVAFPQTDGELIYFGEPLLMKAVARWHFGVLPPGFDITPHPMWFAAWWGMLATALNLLPFGQLDGGHISYAVLGRRSMWVSVATLVAVVVLTILSRSWMTTAILMLVMAYMFGIRHPRMLDEHTPLDGRRRLVAAIALVIFLLCFVPVPIEMLSAGVR